MKRLLAKGLALSLFLFLIIGFSSNREAGANNQVKLNKFGGFGLQAVAWDGNEYVATDGHWYTYHSYDGINWIQGDYTKLVNSQHIAFNSNGYSLVGELLRYGNDIAVQDFEYRGNGFNTFNFPGRNEEQVTYELAVAYSPDGINYEVISGSAEGIPRGAFIQYYGTSDDKQELFWDGKNYVLMYIDTFDDDKFALLSKDGKTFIKKDIGIYDPRKLAPKGYAEFYLIEDIIFDGKSYFATARGVEWEAVLKSSDAIKWDIAWLIKEDNKFFGDIINGNGEYYMIKLKNIYVSKNGVNWVTKKSKLLKEIQAITSVNRFSTQNDWEIEALHSNGTYYMQIYNHQTSLYQNKIYVSKDMDNYFVIDPGYDIGQILLINDDLIIAERAVIDLAKYRDYALKLSNIEVFRGTGNGFKLQKEPTRAEGLVMLVRMLGKEKEAETLKNDPSAFTDVPAWARGYVNYAYQNGLTKGIGNGLFGPDIKMDAKSYTTFMLRALGYEDFQWEKALEMAKDIGLLDQAMFNSLQQEAFARDHVAKISYDTLVYDVKDENQSLVQKLIKDGSIVKDKAVEIGLISE